MKQHHVIPLLLLAFFHCGKSTLAQKALDSILDQTTSVIFENPDQAIATGKKVLEEAGAAKTKINALMLISNAYLSKRENSKSLEYALKARD